MGLGPTILWSCFCVVLDSLPMTRMMMTMMVIVNEMHAHIL